MSDDPSGAISNFNNIMKEVSLTMLGFVSSIASICIFISVYPAMPFMGIVAFIAAMLKTFFYIFRKL